MRVYRVERKHGRPTVLFRGKCYQIDDRASVRQLRQALRERVAIAMRKTLAHHDIREVPCPPGYDASTRRDGGARALARVPVPSGVRGAATLVGHSGKCYIIEGMPEGVQQALDEVAARAVASALDHQDIFEVSCSQRSVAPSAPRPVVTGVNLVSQQPTTDWGDVCSRCHRVLASRGQRVQNPGVSLPTLAAVGAVLYFLTR